MNKKYIYIAIIFVVALFFIRMYKTQDAADMSTHPIKIGASLSLSGSAADFGNMAKKGIDLAVQEINTQGGVKGRKVEVIFEDDQTNAVTAKSVYEKLVHVDKVDAIIGGIFDFTAQPVLPSAEKDNIVYISPVNFITKTFVMNKNTFVMYPNFDKVISKLDVLLNTQDVGRLGMIRFDSGFSESIRDTLQRLMVSRKGDLHEEVYKSIGSSDFRTNILKLKNKNPEFVFLDMLDFDIEKYFKESAVLGFNIPVIGYTTFRDVLNKEKDIRKYNGSYMIDWELPSDTYVENFKKQYGEIPRRGSDKSYEAVYVLAQAVAGSNTKEGVANYMSQHEFKTPISTIKFNSAHGVDDIQVEILHVKDGILKKISESI